MSLVIPGDPAQGLPELRFQANPVYNLYHYLRTLAERQHPPSVSPPAEIARLPAPMRWLRRGARNRSPPSARKKRPV